MLCKILAEVAPKVDVILPEIGADGLAWGALPPEAATSPCLIAGPTLVSPNDSLGFPLFPLSPAIGLAAWG